ncbi:MAG: RluA family pseudouridine synthase [Vagococcus sp.]
MAKQRKNDTKQKQPKETRYQVTETVELLPFLIEHMTHTSRNSVKSILKRGQVMVDGRSITQHNQSLTPGQIVEIQTNKAAMSEVLLMGVDILFEDADIMVVTKDAGLLSVATDKGHELTVYRQLTNYVKQDHPKNRVYIVHRLDRDTSGVMMFAKNEETKNKLQSKWKELVLERTYTALVEGHVRKEQGTITSWLTESKSFKMHACPFDNGGKKAITHYKKIRGNKDYSVLEVNLETGRKNQIRVHMEEIGHPIAGDKKYSARTNPLKRLGLHATTLVFKHPTTGERMTFHSKVPKGFSKAAQAT